MKIISVIFLLLSMNLYAGVVYKTVDKNGAVTFSDAPSEGAVKLDLGETNSAVMPSQAVSAPVKTPQLSQVSYRLRLVSPVPEQTIRSNNGEMTVVASISPTARGQYQLLLNGVLHHSQSSGTFELEELQRGEYSVQVRFVGNSGKLLALTEVQTFYLHKASVLINPN